jgi:hypothetical protein
MSTAFSSIRQAITTEIKRLTGELNKLQKMLSHLGEEGEVANLSPTGKRKYTRRAKPAVVDVSDALKLIEEAGKGGIKAIALAHKLKKNGGGKPSKTDLLATEKVKMTGKGGGSTYVFVG